MIDTCSHNLDETLTIPMQEYSATSGDGELVAPMESEAYLEELDETDGTCEPGSMLARLLSGPGMQHDCGAYATQPEAMDFASYPYVLSAKGVVQDKQRGKAERICGPLILRQLTRGANGYDFGMQIVGITLDNRVVEFSVPATRLHGDPADLARSLADRGIRIVAGKEKQLVSYLDAARDLASSRAWLIAQPRLGWADGDHATFVFPEQVIGTQDSVFQPERVNRMSDACRARGTLHEWNERVAVPVMGDPLAAFMLCASFMAALLRPAGSDSFGYNLCGMTSRGKTTLLQIAASVWGAGSDPGSDGQAFCRRWNATTNALESLAEEHSDLPLPLDELGTFRNPADLGRAIYSLAGGRGAERLKSDGQRREAREWRTLILSSGEISLAELMQQQGQHQKGGQALRIFDIPLPPGGLFAGQAEAGEIVRGLKQAASECYGTAGRAFVAYLIGQWGTHSAMREAIRSRSQPYASELAEGQPPEIARAAQRFALVRVAGELAAEAGVLPFPRAHIEAAVRSVWLRWRANIPDVDDGKRAIHAIASFIAAHPGQFPSTDEQDQLPHTVAGYYKAAEQSLYLFTDDGFGRAIGDIAKPAALEALEKAGLLFKNDTARKKSKHSVNALGSDRAYFYAVRASILGIDGHDIPVGTRAAGSEPGGASPIGNANTRPGTPMAEEVELF